MIIFSDAQSNVNRNKISSTADTEPNNAPTTNASSTGYTTESSTSSDLTYNGKLLIKNVYNQYFYYNRQLKKIGQIHNIKYINWFAKKEIELKHTIIILAFF